VELQKGTVARSAFTEVEEIPAGIPRGRGGRPKVWRLLDNGFEDPGELVEMTRASSLGDALENKFLIHRWDMRNLAFALSRRPDLILKLAAIPDIEEKGHKKEVYEVCKVALDFIGADAAATKGSAIHRLSERVDAGEDLSYLSEHVLAVLARYRELMASVRIVASETFVVCDALGAAGTYDRVVELLADTEVRYTDSSGVGWAHTLLAGTRLILDVKTNANALYFGAVYACQEAVYGNGVPYDAENGRGVWPDGLAPSTEWGLLLHLPADSLADAGFYWVNLTAGYELAQQATAHREAMKRDDLFWPTDLEPANLAPSTDSPATENWLPSEPELGEMTPERLLDLIRVAEAEVEIEGLWSGHESIWTDEHTAAAKARIHDLHSDDSEASAETVQQVHEDVLVEEDTRIIELGLSPQRAKVELIGRLRVAESEAALTALWEAHQAIWDEDCTRMARARVNELVST
jgi:hypothetical protein